MPTQVNRTSIVSLLHARRFDFAGGRAGVPLSCPANDASYRAANSRRYADTHAGNAFTECKVVASDLLSFDKTLADQADDLGARCELAVVD